MTETISQLPAGSALTGTEVFETEQPVGVTSAKITANQIYNFVSGGTVSLKHFGVVGDGSTDDTDAINAAFASLVGASATVIWDVGVCKVTDTIVVGQLAGSGVTSHINIFCPFGQILSGLRWAGATDGTVIAFARNKYFRVIGLGVYSAVARGTTQGIVLGGDNGAGGNAVNNGYFANCLVDGFATGINAGGNNGAASECIFDSLQIQNCDTGFAASDFNSLDFTFNMLALASCGIGIDSSAATGFAVFGGSASQSSTADFKIASNSTQTYIGGGFRSETATAFVLGAGGQVVIDRVLVVDSVSPFKSVSGNFSQFVIRDSVLDGSISPTAITDGGVIEVAGCTLARWDTTRKLPVIFPIADQTLKLRAYFRDNVDSGAFPQRQIMDHQGLMGARYDGAVTVNPFYEPVITVIPIDQASATDFGFDYLALSHVRHLAEGTIPGATAGTAPATGKNLRVRGTFATSATLAFAFKRNLTITSTAVPLVTATTGTFKPTDVGKPLKITAGADTGADWYGYITEYLSSTTVNVFPSFASPGQRYPQSVTKASIVGEDEPDANYFVAGLVGDANETFWVDTIATTGFTLHSSNASSVATVTCLIIR